MARIHRLQSVGDGGRQSQPGIFSWDRIDDGSALLARHLPDDLASSVADFGCGWGYLSREILARSPGIARIDLIDSEHRALEAARANLTDDRATFHWLELAAEPAPTIYDAIVCNPPFHTGRAASPARSAFTSSKAAARAPSGHVLFGSQSRSALRAVAQGQLASFETLADNNKFREESRYALKTPAIRNSLLPSAPVIGLSVRPSTRQPF